MRCEAPGRKIPDPGIGVPQRFDQSRDGLRAREQGKTLRRSGACSWRVRLQRPHEGGRSPRVIEERKQFERGAPHAFDRIGTAREHGVDRFSVSEIASDPGRRFRERAGCRR